MSKRKTRPSQLLYVPPACRTSRRKIKDTDINLSSKCEVQIVVSSQNSAKSSSTEIENISENLENTNLNGDIEYNEKSDLSYKVILAQNKNQEKANFEKECSYSTNDSEDDKEKKEIERAIVKINRKSRSLTEYCENDNNILCINKNQSPECSKNINNKEKEENFCCWEDLLENNKEAKNQNSICKSPQYLIDKKMEDLDHVIEVYDFPDTFKTQDIIHLYNNQQENPIYIKWCDDTHALLVFSTPAQARMALKYDSGIIKSRPLMEASFLSKKIACKIDLKPAMRRPATNMQTARRLINNYLGTKVTISKEDMEKEKKALLEAREKKRLQKQSEKDAWDGHPRTNI